MDGNDVATADKTALVSVVAVALAAARAMERSANSTGHRRARRRSESGRVCAPWVRPLLRVLVHPEVSVPLFMTSAAAVRHAVVRPGIVPPFHLAAWVRRAARYRQSGDRRVVVCLAQLSDAGMACGSVQLKNLAAEIGIDSAHLGRLVKTTTGLGFVDWRRGLRLRPAVRLLAEGDEPVQNIALGCGFAGVDGLARLTEVIHHVFGLPPTEFRTLVRRFGIDSGNRDGEAQRWWV